MQLLSIWLLTALLALRSSHLLMAAETNAGSNIGLKLIAEGLNAPSVLLSIPDGSDRLLVADQAGVIHLLDHGKKSEQPFLDLRGKLVELGVCRSQRFFFLLGRESNLPTSRGV